MRAIFQSNNQQHMPNIGNILSPKAPGGQANQSLDKAPKNEKNKELKLIQAY